MNEFTDKQLAQYFRRATCDDSGIENMPDDYKEGWYAGFVKGRDTQRESDIKVGKRLLESTN